MTIDDMMKKVDAIVKAHENLVIAVQDFTNGALSEGHRKRLEEALKASEALINDD